MMVDIEKTEDDSDKSASKSTKKTLTNDEIRSQSLLFMVAGIDTIATTLSNVSYMLAMNPESQEKLIQEIKSVLAKHVS